MNLKDLKKKIPYLWRVQSFTEKQAVCVAYIDSRDVQDLLDEVCGPENWGCDYKEIKGNLFCGIGIRIGDVTVWKWDCGTESNTEKEKGEASDAFKRAAVKWGVGRFLYDLDIKKIGCKEHTNGKKYPANDKGEIIWNGDDLTKFLNGSKPVTSYNHTPIETNGLPLIPNGVFKALCEEIKSGKFDNIEPAKKTYSFEKVQTQTLNRLYTEAKNVTA